MRVTSLTLPSGLVVEARGLKVKEENLLADRKAQRDPTLWDRLLAAVVERVVEVPDHLEGIDPDEPLRPERMLTGDRMALLYYVRRLTYGDMMDFDWPCRHCGTSNPWTIDLALLPIKALPEASKDALRDGGAFRVTLPDSGDDVAFRLTTGRDEARLARKRKKTRATTALSTQLMLQRVIEINGASPTRAVIDEWGSADADWLREQWDAVDCGVDTTIDVTCACGVESELDVPFGPSFFKRPTTMRRTLGLTPGSNATSCPGSEPETTPAPSSPASESPAGFGAETSAPRETTRRT